MGEARTSEVSLTRALTWAARAVTRHVEPMLRAEALTLDQWLVIDALALGSGGLTMADLAARTMVTGPTLTRVVDRLVTTAAAYREVDAADRRRVRVYLGPRGKATHRRVTAKLDDLEREWLTRRGVASETLEALVRLAAR